MFLPHAEEQTHTQTTSLVPDGTEMSTVPLQSITLPVPEADIVMGSAIFRECKLREFKLRESKLRESKLRAITYSANQHSALLHTPRV